ncbi:MULTISPECIES: hypothetical protein [unclassified Pseudomonas]|uniref:hypothetical protein n=1 Tax=unclassified Pseudomonas TaxID=196821 RepID=UPI0012F2FE54|nr:MULTISPECIES: hypothetical protein [unclassified Pseudomonas]VXB19853.1 conserved exported hypothetical protein [Pseudomonas sp. 8O]
MRVALLSLLLVTGLAQAGVLVNSTVWVVALKCSGYQQCYASSNGSYTGNLNGARRFDDAASAERFISSFTSSIRDKSPQIQSIVEQVCVQPADNRTNGKPC